MENKSDDSHSGENMRFTQFLTEHPYDAAAL